MSYGEAYIRHDLKRGVSEKVVVKRMMSRYPSVTEGDALQLIEMIKSGEDTSVWWFTPKHNKRKRVEDLL